MTNYIATGNFFVFLNRTAIFAGLWVFKFLLNSSINYRYRDMMEVIPKFTDYFILDTGWFYCVIIIFVLLWHWPLRKNTTEQIRDLLRNIADFILIFSIFAILIGGLAAFLPIDPGLSPK